MADQPTPKFGARWYCVSRIGMATLCTGEPDAIKTAADADSLYPGAGPHLAAQLAVVDQYSAALCRALTPRQTEVLILLCKGLSAKETAKLLGISPRTVEHYAAVILAEFGEQSMIGCAVVAAKAGLL